ncbi:MAG: hypothetical protein JSS60_07845 [Verrucomicrobia bacterium]|nr:hypothetical protein [Verrucomicrobiota bacterium]
MLRTDQTHQVPLKKKKWARKFSRFLRESCHFLTTCAIAFGSFFVLVQAGCPDPNFTTGYLGDLGTTSGNCQTFPLPPLSAFGSLSVNQNSPLQPVNRLNPTQLPTTNNFQNFQNPCAINQNTWSNTGTTGIPAGAGVLRMRSGPFLVGMARTGPVATVAQFNYNNNKDFPNLTADNRMTFFFSATEINGIGNDYCNIATNVVNSETCIVSYTSKTNPQAQILDYNLTGNPFHDVYYQNLHPVLAISNPLLVEGQGVLISIDGGPVQKKAFGSTVSGKYFQFFAQRYTPLGPATFVVYAVNSTDSGITFTLLQNASDHILFTCTSPYTGFIRLASVSTNDPAPASGNTWVQNSYFMPEDIGNSADTSNPPSTCAIEDPACGLVVTSASWWKTAQVHSISPTGMSFYMLFPTAWANSFTSLAIKTMGATWMNTAGTNQFPTSQALSDVLHIISTINPGAANGYYSNFFTALNPSGMAPYTDGSDFVTNFFTLQFDMFMGNNLATTVPQTISAFQTASRVLPSYTITAPVNNIAVYTAHRLNIPVRADISTTANSVSWTYTISPLVQPPGASNKVLMCFPFWKYLQGTTPGMVNTTPGGGQPLQNFIFNDTIKGTLYAAEAINGVVTFLEGGIPSWYGTGAGQDLFIPPTLAFSPPQMSALATALTQIGQEVIPLPFFPENRLDPGYNAGKTCYMLAKTALYIAFYMKQNGSTNAQIVAATQPYLDNAKSCINAYVMGRTPGSSYFVADRTCGGICVNGAGGDGTWALGPNLQQSVDSGVDFGNYVYNDHHFFAGYFLLSTAMVTQWEKLYGGGISWINTTVTGADNQTYKVRDMIDFLWRDVHNPFTNNTMQAIYDLDMPYDRYGLPWEGHSVANGLQYQPNALGRNQESISEDFNCWLGMNAYASLVLQTALTAPETARYTALYNFSLMNMKLNASAGIQWFKNTTYWKGVNMYSTSPTSTAPAIHIGQFTQATVSNGQVNDQSAQNQTFF